MGIKSQLALAISLILTLLFFQNCGGFSKNDKVTDISLVGPAPLVSGEGGFNQGDAFDPSLIPYSITDQAFIDILAGYAGRTGFKALAFNEDGAGYMSSTNSQLITSQNEWNRMILERCHLSTGKPCSLFAEGDYVAQNEEDFYAGFVPIIDVPADGQFDPLKIPGLNDHWRNQSSIDYPQYDPGQVKAYAIGPHGNTSAGWSASGDMGEARRRARQYCEALNGATGCILYAENNIIVFDLDNFAFPAPTIQYAPGTVNFDDIPFVTDARMAQIKSIGEAALQVGNHFLIVLGRYGQSSALDSATAISQQQIDDTVADCKAQITNVDPNVNNQDPTCVVYSIDNEIRMTRNTLEQAFY